MFFEQNRRALLSVDPGYSRLLACIQTAPVLTGDEIALVPASAPPTPTLPRKGGGDSKKEYTARYRDVWLHDPVSPSLEARRAFKSSCKARDGHVHLIIGLGLGYALDEAFHASREPIVVYEPDIALLRFVLENMDLSGMLGSR